MAKVTGPLHSEGASGKIADSIVFFPWKGINVVRQWLKPSNPKTEDQGDQRIVLGGLGKSCRACEATSLYRDDAILVTPSGKTWVSALVKYCIDSFMPDAAGFEAMYTAYAAHAQKAVFDSTALEVNLADFDISYKGTAHAFVAGLQLYMLAKYGIAKVNSIEGAFDRTPFTVALADWDAANIQSLQDDLEAV